MPAVIYTDCRGERHEIEVEIGVSVMAAAKRSGVPGMLAECGGSLTCATCHVYVSDEWTERLPPVREDEDEMLDEVSCPRLPNSRLSCQVLAAADLDGLTVSLPETQQ